MQSEMGTILDDQAQKIHELVNKAQQIAAIETLGLSEETQRIQELEAQLQRPLAVAVIGEFSTGKSSFINAVLGRDFLPAKYVPTTQQTMRIHHVDPGTYFHRLGGPSTAAWAFSTSPRAASAGAPWAMGTIGINSLMALLACS